MQNVIAGEDKKQGMHKRLEEAMKYREYGTTGMMDSEVGFGAGL